MIRLLILISHLCLSYMWFGVAQGHVPKRQVFKRDWIVCSKYDNHSRLNSQHDWG